MDEETLIEEAEAVSIIDIRQDPQYAAELIVRLANALRPVPTIARFRQGGRPVRHRYARRIRAGIAASRLPVLHQLLWLGNVANDLALRAYWRARNKHIRSTPDSGARS